MSSLSALEIKTRRRLRDDFPHYAAKCLKIRTKAGEIIPFRLNAVQRRVHAKAEEQLAETGRVRILVLKARQPGISTYIEGRLYSKTTHRHGVRAFILTHRDQATENLFAVAKRFHDNCPALVRPQIKASNAKELEFGRLDSGYRVGTAKASGIGRSDTIQLFHGSEVAFWANADEHAAGVLQAVPDEDGTEIWLESTGNGMGGLFYNMCKAALRGENGYMLVFIPWFEHDEYEKAPPEGWVPPGAIGTYGEAHGLTVDQLYWAYVKNGELAAAEGLPSDEICWRFRQEYPGTAEEAFQASRTDSFIKSDDVAKAKRSEVPEQGHAALVFGCDFARGERDWNWFIDRKGRAAGRLVNEKFHSADTVEIAGKLARLIDEHKPAMCFLDTGGGGAQVYDILVDRGYGAVLTLVEFGGKPSDARKYLNKRAEMWGDGRDWLKDPGGAAIPDDDELHAHICAPGWKENMNHQIVLEPKDKIRERMGFSTDGGDALFLTFAEPVMVSDRANESHRHVHPGAGGWMS